MKQLFITIALVMVCHALLAQKGQVTKAVTYKDSGELEKALGCIQSATDPANEKSAKSVSWPRTWQVQGEIYQAIYKSADKKYGTLSSDPLTDAFDSYKKAVELDIKNRYGKSLKVNLVLLVNDLQSDAINAYNDSVYNKALTRFEQILEINEMPVVKDDKDALVDTAIVYNCGLAAMNARQHDKAIHYLERAAELGYNEETALIWIANAYESEQDTVKALETLQKALLKYQNDERIMNSMIQILLNLNRRDEAIQYLDIAITQKPDNIDYYLTKGDLYNKIDDEENAIKLYEEALKVDSVNFIALYNLGVIYYNRGVKQVELAADVPVNDQEAYKSFIKKSEIWWGKSLPYMEKCYLINPNDEVIRESLKNVYYRLKMMDKYKEIQNKL
ncbi:tetratricopeptide repeat protein [Maribellus luteus]|uniref:Tetratricopeptide repeat protein n=1 Tax=Maribellus luteus TaxID=2305463 RepID=A0A399T093_9BACT|nr:tetratricopeptide repeat protein [Maribellus luteus]RIJ47403.1 tetratricopeptide repeat protein [Maribellus luteus]